MLNKDYLKGVAHLAKLLFTLCYVVNVMLVHVSVEHKGCILGGDVNIYWLNLKVAVITRYSIVVAYISAVLVNNCQRYGVFHATRICTAVGEHRAYKGVPLTQSTPFKPPVTLAVYSKLFSVIGLYAAVCSNGYLNCTDLKLAVNRLNGV